VLVHGFPTSGRSWEKQVAALYRAGFRVVAYDRRGFGHSSMPAFGYDFETLTADLRTLITTLELRDVALVGFGMGGGEVARYFGRYGSGGVRRAAFISSITPALFADAEDADGGALTCLERMQVEINTDRFAFARRFLAHAYTADGVMDSPASPDVLARDADIAAAASFVAMHDSVGSWAEDFRSDLARVGVPALVIHGTGDRIAPIATTGRRMPAYLANATLTALEGAPHGLTWTHAARVNAALLEFLR
jgi:non-heme chloroperoxidase